MKKLLLLCTSVVSGMISAQPTYFEPRGVGGGGAFFSPSINPTNPNEFFVASDMTELFHTTDFGLSYSCVNFQQLQAGHNSKVCYTASPGELYCVNYDNDMAVPVRSTNNGSTWTALPGNPDNTEETYTIHADYNNPARVIISYYGEIFFSSNSGTTFTSIHTAATASGNVVGGVFFDNNNIYIGTNDGVLVSTNGGANWTTATISGIPATQRIFSFAAASSGNTTRFFCLTVDVNDIYVGLQGSDYWGLMQGVYRCDYGSTGWTSCTTGLVAGTDFPMFVAMAQTDINTVYLAGSNSSGVPDILKSTSAGNNWTHVFNSTGNQNIVTGWSGQGGDRGWGYGECPFGVSVCPFDPNYIIFSDFGFVHKSSDGGSNWNQAYTDTSDQHAAGSNTPQFQSYHSIGLENTTCWQVIWSDSSHLFAAFSDIRGIRSTDAGNSWSFDYTGHTANSMYRIARRGDTLIAVTSGIHDMYQSTRLQDNILDQSDAAGKIIYSTDHGATWNDLHLFNHPVFWIAVDPNNSNRAYVSVIHYNGGNGVGGIYRCDDLQNLASSTWTLLSDPPRTQKHPASITVLNDGNVLCSYSGRRNSSGTFTNSSGVFLYNPVSANWTDLSDPGMYYWTKDVVVDPNDASQNTWYAAVFSGWGGPPNGLGGLYKTVSRGQSWTRISNIDRVTSCTFDPTDANTIYVTTEQDGLWMSMNVNNASPLFTAVGSYEFRQPERVFFNPYNPNEIWLTSFGNGLRMSSTLTNNHPTQLRNEISIWPNPVSDYFMLDWTGEAATAQIFDATGRLVQHVRLTTGRNTIPVAVSPGLYYLAAGNFRTTVIVAGK